MAQSGRKYESHGHVDWRRSQKLVREFSDPVEFEIGDQFERKAAVKPRLGLTYSRQNAAKK